MAALVAFAESVGRPLPSDYVELLHHATEIEIDVEGRGYVRIWSPSGVVELNGAYNIQKYLPGALAVGDDEGGKVFVLMVGERGPGIYRSSFADPDPGEAVYIAPSFEALLGRGVGIDKLFAWEA
jgi:hypothetical protein